jgi:hypothetical protein
MYKFKKEIDKARPFYLAKAEADALRTQLLSSTISFQKANGEFYVAQACET